MDVEANHPFAHIYAAMGVPFPGLTPVRAPRRTRAVVRARSPPPPPPVVVNMSADDSEFALEIGRPVPITQPAGTDDGPCLLCDACMECASGANARLRRVLDLEGALARQVSDRRLWLLMARAYYREIVRPSERVAAAPVPPWMPSAIARHFSQHAVLNVRRIIGDQVDGLVRDQHALRALMRQAEDDDDRPKIARVVVAQSQQIGNLLVHAHRFGLTGGAPAASSSSSAAANTAPFSRV
jgi:hypothetical protein